MATTEVKTSVTELPNSRVRVEAEVPAGEVDKRVEQAARSLGRDLRIPGFRKGKVPAAVIVQRVGREAVLDEAVRGSLGGWYAQAIDAAGIDPVGDPEVDLGDLPGAGEPLRFNFEIGVRPVATLGDYKGVEVGRREAAVADDELEGQLEQLRERHATLDTHDGAAQDGDFVVIDFVGSIDGVPFEGGEGRDQLVELGSGRFIPGFEEQLVGAGAGEERTLSVTFPEDYQATHLAGKAAEFATTVREVKRKRLPALDDELAAGEGFDTLEELREDTRSRMAEHVEAEIDREYREAVLDAVAANATIDLPDELVRARAGELWEQMLHALSHQGISREAYLQISGRSEEELLEEAKPDAARGLARDAVIAAVIDAESIEPSEEQLFEALAPAAERERATPEKLLERLRSAGREDALRREVAARMALDLLVEQAKPIPAERAAAREQIWTPGEEKGSGATLWTPGQE